MTEAFIVVSKSGEAGLFTSFDPAVFINSPAMHTVAFLQRAPLPTPKELKHDDDPAH